MPVLSLLSDCAQPQVETLHLLNLEEFTDLINGYAPATLLRNACVILRMVVTARYLHLKAQELHDALISAHITIGNNLEEKIRLRDQLAAMSTKHHQAKAAATFNEERARTAEWDANQLRGQLGLAQQDLIRARNAHTTALGQAHAQAADLDDRLKASNQQAASLVESAARLQHRIRESLHQRRWTEAQIHSLMSPTNSSSSSAVPGGNASSSSSSRSVPVSG